MFTGVYTAIITPFRNDMSFDDEAFAQILKQQIAGGVDGIVVLGTTGESPTISHEEHTLILQKALEIADNKITMIAGTGSNSTQEAIELSIKAEKLGYEALLQVNPYYNKPTQEGLFQHFKMIAQSVNIPIILYNIPGRTGVNLETPTLVRLSECPNIVAVKEASGDLDQMREVIAHIPKKFSVLSGDDNLTLELMKMGGHGVISVLANALPSQMKALTDAATSKNWTKANNINQSLAELFKNCFIETNPQPIKTIMAHLGFCAEVFRLPMVNMSPQNKAILIKSWENFITNEI